MRTIHPSPLLQSALLADAFISGAAAMLHLLLNPYVARKTGLDSMLLLWSGLFLLGYTNQLLVLAFMDRIRLYVVRSVVVINVIWAAGCALILTLTDYASTPLARAFVLAQAIVVLALAAIEYAGLHDSPGVPSRHFAPVGT